MGNKITTFSDQQLECYQDCTYFTRKEIITVFKRFRDLDLNRVPKVMSDDDCTNIRIAQDKLEKLPDLKENPLKERICKVFSSDSSGNMTFDDFLNMCSLFNEQCPRNTKIHYAFQIYDYDGDGFIGPDDLKKTLVALTKNRLTQDEVDIVCSKVMDEADHDNDGQISFLEFKHVVSRSPDFMRRQFPNVHQVFKPRYNKEYFKRLTARIETLEDLIQRRFADHDPNLSRENLELIKQQSPRLVNLKDRYDKLYGQHLSEESRDEQTTAKLQELESQAAELEDLIMPTVTSIPNRFSRMVPAECVVKEKNEPDFLARQNLTKILSYRKLSFINNCYSKSVVGPNSHYYHNIGAKLQHGLSDYFVTQLEKENFIPYSGLCMVKSAVIEAANSSESREFSTDPCRVLADEQRFTTLHLTEASRESLMGFITTLGHIKSNNPVRLVTHGAGYRRGSEWFDGDDSRVTQFETVHAVILNSSIEKYSTDEYLTVSNIIWNIYKKLDLPTRLVHCSLDNMFSHEFDAHRIDIWLPSQKDWIPVGRISHYLDYLSIRAGLKRGHLLDSCVFDGQALVAAIIENRQTSTGQFIIPEAIQDHMPPMDNQELSKYTTINSVTNDFNRPPKVLQNYEQRRYFMKKKALLNHSQKAVRLGRIRSGYLNVRYVISVYLFFILLIDWGEVWRSYLNNFLRGLIYDYVKRPVRRMWWRIIYDDKSEWPEDLCWDEHYERTKDYYLQSISALSKDRYYTVLSEPDKPPVK